VKRVAAARTFDEDTTFIHIKIVLSTTASVISAAVVVPVAKLYDRFIYYGELYTAAFLPLKKFRENHACIAFCIFTGSYAPQCL
jgi:hypothetical protein